MNLYYIQGSCALAPHIVAIEAGIAVEAIEVDFPTKTIVASGADYLAVNPKGYVPALELDDGEVLTEAPVVVQYLADLKPEAKLPPANGTLARARLQEALNYISTEIHQGYGPLFNPAAPAEVRAERSAFLRKRYALLDKQLEGRTYLFGDQFTAADALLFAMTRWAPGVGLDLSDYRMKAQGLIKD
jgi:glutathione S-transferase